MNNTSKNNKNSFLFNSTIILKIVFSGLFTVFILKMIVILQLYIFNKINSLMFVCTNGFCLFLLWIFSLMLMPVFVIPNNFKNKHITAFKLKIIKIYVVLSIFIVSFSILNYCIITPDKIIIRDIRTLFFEKTYSLEDIKIVKVSAYRVKGSINKKYVINIANCNINLMNSGIYNKQYLKNISIIHRILKNKGIPMTFDMEINTGIFY